MLKRGYDIFVSLFLIILLLSWICPLVYLVSRFTMKGSILFKQKRSGKDGKEFWILKFRTMRENDEADQKQATDDDPRCTRLGHFLRWSCIDELPQLFNILKGEMSMVGPRPHMVYETEYYQACLSNYMERLKIKPGLTGWAQVNGYRGATPELWMMQKRIEHDIWYIENRSFWLDNLIVCKEFALFFKKLFKRI